MDFFNTNFFWNTLWIIPVIILLFLYSASRKKKILISIIGKRYADPIYVNISHSKRRFKIILFVIAIFLLTVCIARPYWGRRILPISSSGRDILIIMDVSKSMLSNDIQPSRLSHSKNILKKLIANTPGDRYGLIIFSGTAFLECPLTSDKTSLFTTLNEANTQSIPVGGTNIEAALRTGLKALESAAGGYRCIILVTDGDELQGNSTNVVSTLKKKKIPLIILGIGNPNTHGLIQMKNKSGKTSFLRDKDGHLVKSKLDEKRLEELAGQTGGIYIRSTSTNSGLSTVISRIKKIVPEKYKKSQIIRPLERFQIPLSISLILFFLWQLINERRVYKKNEK